MINKTDITMHPLSEYLVEYKELNSENKYRPVAVGRYGIRTRESIYSKELANDYSKNRVIYKGTLTVGMGSVQMDIGILSDDSFYSVSPAYHTYKISGIDYNYLRYCLQCRNSDMFVRFMKRGSRQGKSIDLSRWITYRIPVYPSSIQREIVERLDKVQTIISSLQKQIQLFDDLIKARFVEMFGNPVLNDKGWEQKTLGEITTKIGSGATPKGGKEAYQEEGITLIRSMNVHNGQFEYKDLAHISDEQAAKLDNVSIEENDVLLNITGASVARSCVVPAEVLPARVNQHVCVIRCKECIIPEFLNTLLIDDNYQDLLWGIAGSGATREAITKQQVENLQIIMPSIDLQNEFMKFVKQIDKSKFAVQKALEKAQLLFDSLMQKYFG